MNEIVSFIALFKKKNGFHNRENKMVILKYLRLYPKAAYVSQSEAQVTVVQNQVD